eukprot:Phypoly_transcript_08411.p1 GENE.Phypoly_transcript_08411~~Phypoly_transcript_08411.p1  ORF type:complete len:439 (+),score=70.38 Phypoly_transcript_08411:81-1319(+)
MAHVPRSSQGPSSSQQRNVITTPFFVTNHDEPSYTPAAREVPRCSSKHPIEVPHHPPPFPAQNAPTNLIKAIYNRQSIESSPYLTLNHTLANCIPHTVQFPGDICQYPTSDSSLPGYTMPAHEAPISTPFGPSPFALSSSFPFPPGYDNQLADTLLWSNLSPVYPINPLNSTPHFINIGTQYLTPSPFDNSLLQTPQPLLPTNPTELQVPFFPPPTEFIPLTPAIPPTPPFLAPPFYPTVPICSTFTSSTSIHPTATTLHQTVTTTIPHPLTTPQPNTEKTKSTTNPSTPSLQHSKTSQTPISPVPFVPTPSPSTPTPPPSRAMKRKHTSKRSNYTNDFQRAFHELVRKNNAGDKWSTFRRTSGCSVERAPCSNGLLRFCEDLGGDFWDLAQAKKFSRQGTRTMCACAKDPQ